MMGDGSSTCGGCARLVDAAGYDGPIEVEILNPAIWDLPRAELMRTMIDRFETCVRLAALRRRRPRREPVRQHDAPLRAAGRGSRARPRGPSRAAAR